VTQPGSSWRSTSTGTRASSPTSPSPSTATRRWTRSTTRTGSARASSPP